MSVSSNIAGFLKGLQKAREKAHAAGVKAVNRFGAIVLSQAQAMTPVDTGHLAASATQEPAQITDEQATVKLGFNADYAAIVHERLDLKHKVGQAKFLEVAIRRMTPKFEPYVAGEVKKAMEGQ